MIYWKSRQQVKKNIEVKAKYTDAIVIPSISYQIRITLLVYFPKKQVWRETVSNAQKIKRSIEYFFSECDQVRRKLHIWSHLLKKSLMQNFVFFAVIYIKFQGISRIKPHKILYSRTYRTEKNLRTFPGLLKSPGHVETLL